jgi:hypothetical protein
MAVTRIYNNQITDSTITAAKIATGTLTGNLFASSLTLNSNVTINGNLFLSNTGNVTTINATNTYINDPLVMFNNGYTGSLTGYDIGILINRNLASLGSYGTVNTFLGWVEADSAFETLATTDTGTGVTSINNAGFTNFKTGNITALTTTTGGLQAVAIGNTTPGSGAFTTGTFSSTLGVTGATTMTTATAGGLQAVAIGNATPGSGAFTTLTGGSFQGIIGNATPTTAFFTTATATTVNAATVGNIGANVVGTGTYLTSLTATNVVGTVTTANVSMYDNVATSSTNATYYPQLSDKSSGNVGAVVATGVNVNPSTSTISALGFVGGTGAFTTLSASGVTTLTSATTATSTSSGALQVTGGVGIGGNLYVGGISVLTGNVTIGGNLTVTGQSVSIGASTLSINDPIINLNTPSDLTPLTTPTTADIGIKFHYYDNADSAAFLGRAADTGYLEWYTKGTDNANVFAGTYYGTIKSGALILANARVVGGGLTANTGTLQVWGDGSVTGNLFVGGTLQATAIGNVTPGTGTFTTLTVNSTSTHTGVATFTTANTGGLQATAIGNITPGTGAFTTLGGTTITASTQFSGPGTGLTGTASSLSVNYATSAGSAGSSTTSGTATNADNIAVATASASTNYIAMATGTSGYQALKVGSALTWNDTTTTLATGNLSTSWGANVNTGQNAGAAASLYVSGKRDTTLIWARPNATYDAVIMGNSATNATVVNGAKLQINTNDSILLPVGTNAQRPTASGLGTDTTGMLRYSSTQGAIEWYTGASWASASTSFTVIGDQQFTGTGSQTVFTLSDAQTTNSCIVSINGVVQIPTLAYGVTSGTTLTFTEAPGNGEVIDVRKLTTTVTVTGIASSNGYMQLQIDNSGVYVYTGSASTAVATYWDTSGAKVNSRANVTTSTVGDATLDSFYANTFSSAEYTVTATLSGTSVREIAKVIMVHNGTTATRTVFAVTNTAGNSLVTYSANIVNGSATLYGTPTNANTIFRIKKDYQAI